MAYVPLARAQGQSIIHPWSGVSGTFLESCSSQSPWKKNNHLVVLADGVNTMWSTPLLSESRTHIDWINFRLPNCHSYLYVSPWANLVNKKGKVFAPGLWAKQRGVCWAEATAEPAKVHCPGALPVLCSGHSILQAIPLMNGLQGHFLLGMSTRWQNLSF